MAFGFVDPKVGTLKVKVAVDSNTNIAQAGDVVTGNSFVGINGFSMDASFDDAQTVFGKILGDIAGATYDSDTTLRTFTVGVGEKDSPELSVDDDDITLAAGASTTVTVSRLGDGVISVTPQSALEGVTYSVSGTSITFTNSTASSGTGAYIVTCAETGQYSAGMAFINVTAA